MDGEHLKREVLMMEKGNKDKPEMEEHVLVPKRVNITHEGVEVSGSTVRWLSLLKETGREAHTECCRRRIEEELRGTVEQKQYRDLRRNIWTKRREVNKSNEAEPGGRMQERGETTVPDGRRHSTGIKVQTAVAPR